jgi:hypothetical protein
LNSGISFDHIVVNMDRDACASGSLSSSVDISIVLCSSTNVALNMKQLGSDLFCSWFEYTPTGCGKNTSRFYQGKGRFRSLTFGVVGANVVVVDTLRYVTFRGEVMCARSSSSSSSCCCCRHRRRRRFVVLYYFDYTSS